MIKYTTISIPAQIMGKDYRIERQARENFKIVIKQLLWLVEHLPKIIYNKVMKELEKKTRYIKNKTRFVKNMKKKNRLSELNKNKTYYRKKVIPNIIPAVFHPNRIMKLSNKYKMDCCEFLEWYYQ